MVIDMNIDTETEDEDRAHAVLERAAETIEQLEPSEADLAEQEARAARNRALELEERWGRAGQPVPAEATLPPLVRKLAPAPAPAAVPAALIEARRKLADLHAAVDAGDKSEKLQAEIWATRATLYSEQFRVYPRRTIGDLVCEIGGSDLAQDRVLKQLRDEDEELRKVIRQLKSDLDFAQRAERENGDRLDRLETQLNEMRRAADIDKKVQEAARNRRLEMAEMENRLMRAGVRPEDLNGHATQS